MTYERKQFPDKLSIHQALRLISKRVGSEQSAKEQILDALVDGAIDGWEEDIKNGFALSRIDRSRWLRIERGEYNKMTMNETNDFFPFGFYVYKLEIDKIWPHDLALRAKDEVKTAKKGRPPETDWDRFWIEVATQIYDYGMPEVQAELIRNVLQALQEKEPDQKQPHEDDAKRRISRLYRVSQGRG
jgi:hypothetical protein